MKEDKLFNLVKEYYKDELEFRAEYCREEGFYFVDDMHTRREVFTDAISNLIADVDSISCCEKDLDEILGCHKS